MTPLFSFLHSGCTQVLNATIAQERITYASQRIDFHTYFPFATLPDIQRILRNEKPRDDVREKRQDIVLSLLRAHRRNPHRLWTLLLVQAFEPTLVLRRRGLGEDEDLQNDQLVFAAFLKALGSVRYDTPVRTLHRWVACAFAREITRQARLAAREHSSSTFSSKG